MHDDANEPMVVPVYPRPEAGPARWARAVLLLGIGGGVGLALGVLVTIGAVASYTFFSVPTPSPNRDWLQVFDELNELRQQVNRINEERKVKDQETVAAIRQAVSAAASMARSDPGATRGVGASAEKQSGGEDQPRVARTWDPLAEVDEEIKRLEGTQKVLNTILDLFTPKDKERAKDRSGDPNRPE